MRMNWGSIVPDKYNAAPGATDSNKAFRLTLVSIGHLALVARTIAANAYENDDTEDGFNPSAALASLGQNADVLWLIKAAAAVLYMENPLAQLSTEQEAEFFTVNLLRAAGYTELLTEDGNHLKGLTSTEYNAWLNKEPEPPGQNYRDISRREADKHIELKKQAPGFGAEPHDSFRSGRHG